MLPGVAGWSETGFKQVLASPNGEHIVLIGNGGSILLLSARTRQLVATLHGGGGVGSGGSNERRRDGKGGGGGGGGGWSCQTAVFSADGDVLFTGGGGGGKVQVWDLRRRCCAHTWHDSGGLRCTALDVSADGEYLAAGADSGAVTLYRCSATLRSARPAAVKEFLNLRTVVTDVSFNAQTELLAASSKYVKEAMRVAHVGARSVFSNWPTSKTPLGYVQGAAFSPHSAYAAIANDKGKVLLYRLNHYEAA